MAFRKTLDSLKEGSKEDKVAFASTIAIGVVVLLFAVWGITFLRSVQSNSPQINVDAAQEQLQQSFASSSAAQSGDTNAPIQFESTDSTDASTTQNY